MSSSTQSLAGKVVAITGAGRGIGLATAREALRRGATVVVGDVDGESVEMAAAELGQGAHPVQVDVSDADSMAAFVKAAEAVGPLSVLVNNAGIMPIGEFLALSPAAYRRAVEINVLGAIFGTHAALPAMLERGAGQIINVASTAGKAPVPGGATYCATKAAVVAFTETTRVEYAGTGVDFTCVLPHFTNTELIAGTSGTRGIPVVEPDDVAKGICYAIEKPRPDVYVPKVIGTVLATQPLMGRTVRDAINRRLGAYRAFLDFDHGARARYDDRIAQS
ncbi:SDR family oxidoreductase [Nocardioides marmorisolisilvae]|uniref:SDR family oxidoreductase n=1 Tax=Nocardioides marmorisolisilvae TaxID=1542737 RepID=A0A3N0DX46_9ACTN|nr:SDR family oxidoreductase [Nocardioides marmorisolisilvae]RNL80179.1 SDR family oxidoreductase [Nocardioides marmorisolisilvae]